MKVNFATLKKIIPTINLLKNLLQSGLESKPSLSPRSLRKDEDNSWTPTTSGEHSDLMAAFWDTPPPPCDVVTHRLQSLTFEQGQRSELHLGALVAELGRAVGPPLPGSAHRPPREAVHLLRGRHREAGRRRGRAGRRQLGRLHDGWRWWW